MSSTLVTREGAVTLTDRASLAAVVAGGLVAVAVGSLLHLLGLAVGASSVNAVAGATPGAGTAVLLYGAWLMLTMLISMAVGAFVAGRLADTASPVTAGLHGLAVWAAALLIGAVLALGAIGGVVNLAGRTAGAVAGTAATSAAAMAGGAGGLVVQGGAAQAIDPARAADRIRDALTAPADPRAMTTEQATAELARMAAARVTDGEWNQADRDRAAILTARVAGISEQEAAQRITAMETQARDAAARTEAAAREAADQAARATAIAAFWMFAALLLGAAAAVFAGRMGAKRPVVVDATGTTVLGRPVAA